MKAGSRSKDGNARKVCARLLVCALATRVSRMFGNANTSVTRPMIAVRMNTYCQPANCTMKPPITGDMIGEITTIDMTCPIMRAESSRLNMSRIVARLTTMPAAPPTAWMMRPMISTSMLGDQMQMPLPMMNSSNPTTSTGLRPKRSAAGP